MTSDFEIALGLVAPIYNLILASIVFYLFIKLFALPNRLVYLKPWKVLFAAFIVYVVEEILTVLRKTGIANFPTWFTMINGIFEMIIIGLFIYMLFLQKEYVKDRIKIVNVPSRRSHKR